ncbi:hypothetical protein [Actinokineospora bangkokensis]|uniref:Uncharacterized protein n=1 Tax=Actinokineospora bangkokensis TaxID=1193682 RepID=A0A1Q9LN47_9PSEU|nr:hypothetical protein [Actinokineospora bangkokensis]OLR93450.1 hypothetical protein BJP25_14165 [Actinokineospora bangkokensis]
MTEKDIHAEANALRARLASEPPRALIADTAALAARVVDNALAVTASPDDGAPGWHGARRAQQAPGERITVHNTITGNAGNVIQAGTIHGDVVFRDHPRR